MGVVVGGRRRGEASARAARRDPRLHGCAVWGPTRPWVRVRVRVRVRVGLGLGWGLGVGVRVRVRARVGLGAVVRAGREAQARHERGGLWTGGGAPFGQGAPAGVSRRTRALQLVQGLVLLPTALLDVSLRRWHGNALEQERVGAVSRLRVRPRPFPLRRAAAARLACDRCVTGAPTHAHQGHLPLSPSPDPGNAGAPEQPPSRR